MTQLFHRLRLWVAALLLTPTLLVAAPYEVVGGIGINQTGGPFITDLGNGTSRWVTPIDWTNNNAFTTGTLFFVVTRQWAGQVDDANAMQWDNAAGVFRKGNLVAEGDNEDRFIALSDTDINVAALNPVFDVDGSDSLAAFRIGALAPGQTLGSEINFLLTSSINTMFLNGFIVEQRLPLPGSLPLVLAAAFAWSAVSARRRR
jgi:hypothetical protein